MLITPEFLEQLIKKEDEYLIKKQSTSLACWEDYELGLTHKEAKKLYEEHLIDIDYRSNSSTMYKLNRDNIQTAIRMLRDSDVFLKEKSTPSDLFDTIIGYDLDKQIIKNYIVRKDVYGGFLLWGPPASAKSMFLWELNRIPNSYYTTASSSTKVGLSDILIERQPTLLLIDELDKGNTRTFDVLLSLMENGIVTTTKHDHRIMTKVNTKVIAAANDISKLPPEIRSRFILREFKKYTPQQMEFVGINLLNKKYPDLNEDIVRYTVKNTIDKIRNIDARDFIKIINLCPEDHSKIKYHDVDMAINFIGGFI